MITEQKKWMTYTYFHRHPGFRWGTTHLFSPIRKRIPFMIRVPFPTMTVNLEEQDFVKNWSKSTRYKINKAEKEELTLERGRFLLPAIIKLFSGTANQKKLRGHVYSDFDSRPWIECSALSYEGVMLCSHVWFVDTIEKRALLYINASNAHNEHEDASLTGRAHYYLLWQDGLYLQSLGIDTMDLQGYEPKSKNKFLKGVYTWKEGTHGKEELLYHYYPLWFYVLRKFRNMLTG